MMLLFQNRLLLGFVVLLFAAIAAPEAPGQVGSRPFEGTIDFKVQDIVAVGFYRYHIKDRRVRVEEIEAIGSTPYVLIDYWSKVMYYILPGSDKYMEFPIRDSSPAEEEEMAQRLEFETTGEREVIFGYRCDKLVLETDGGSIEVWGTREIAPAVVFPGSLEQPPKVPKPWQLRIVELGYFPMRIVQLDSDGYEEMRYEVTSIQRRPVAEVLLRVPPAFERTDTLPSGTAPRRRP